MGAVLGILGGPDYRVTYPNGDESAYVVSVFDAMVIGGIPRPDDDEASEVGRFKSEELPVRRMGPLTQAIFRDLGLT